MTIITTDDPPITGPLDVVAVPDRPLVGAIAPGRPVRLVAVNPWLPWVNRVGGFTLGVIIAAAVSILLGCPMPWLAAGTAIAAALVFAWVVAGHELRQRRPTTFRVAE
jgi:hypothetical protein